MPAPFKYERKRGWVVTVRFLLVPGLVLGTATVAWLAQGVLRAARAATPIHFDQGLTVLVPRAPAGWTDHACGSCHSQAYEQWIESRHAVAGVNDNFQAQFRHDEVGRKQWCLNCHAPAN